MTPEEIIIGVERLLARTDKSWLWANAYSRAKTIADFAARKARAAALEAAAKVAEDADIGPANHWPTGKSIAAKIRSLIPSKEGAGE